MKLRIPILGALLAVALLFSLAACSPTPPDNAAGIAFVVGDRANSALPDAVALARHIPSTMPVGSVITVTGVDGSPDGVAQPSFTLVDQGDSYDNSDELLGGVSRIKRELASATATSAQADVLGAISTAARSISTVDGTRTILINDSMVSTASALQFQNHLLTADPSAVAAAVPASLLPDLRGDAIVLINEGDTAGSQAPLSQTDRRVLKAIWVNVLHRAHAESISYLDTSPEYTEAASAPTVSSVPVSATQGISFPTPCTAVVPESKIEFVGNESAFVDRSIATASVKTVAAALSNCKGDVTVAGTTADGGGTTAFNTSLSLSRAKVVRTILASAMGVEQSSITAEGLGTHFPGFVPDLNSDGSLNEASASQDRTVIISVTPSN
jgi:outer membrane protein OmpA-like peptidoglycan-associated protein